MAMTQTLDPAKAGAFTGRVLGDTAATTSTVLAALGDRLGLFKALAAGGPMTPAELALGTGTNERYVREWLAGMAAAGYLDRGDEADRYELPAEHAPTLADEPGPSFFGGVHQELLGTIMRYEQLLVAFRGGGGVELAQFPEDVQDGIARFTTMWHENLLTQVWLPSIPEAEALLARGADVADIGCGQGKALVKLVQTYPQSRYVGYDALASNIQKARANAAAAGVG